MSVSFNQENASVICGILQKLSETNSRNEKRDILTANKTEEFAHFLYLALNPYNNFYNIAENIQHDVDPKVSTTDSLIEDCISGNLNLRTDEGILEFSQRYAGLPSDDERKIVHCIVSQDIRCGVGATTVNKVFEKLIPIVPYMRCSLPKQVPLESLPWAEGIISQEKADGMFANIDYLPTGEIKIRSRQGTTFDTKLLFGKYEQAYIQILQNMLQMNHETHGEMLVIKEENSMVEGGKSWQIVLAREEGNGLLNSVLQGSELPEGYRVQFCVWDAIPLDNAMNAIPYEVVYSARFSALLATVMGGYKRLAKEELPEDLNHIFAHVGAVKMIPTKVVHSLEEAREHYRQMLANGKEGTVVKTKRGIWKNTTSKDQVKLKLTVDCDLEVLEVEEGKGKYEKMAGALRCKSADGLLEVSVGGFDDVTRQVFWDNAKDVVGKIITVRFNDVMKPKEEGELASLFLPRFVELRTDKTIADTYQQVLDAQSAAILSA